MNKVNNRTTIRFWANSFWGNFPVKLSIIFVCFTVQIIGQNLIPNPGLEEFSGTSKRTSTMFSSLKHWYCVNTGSPDLLSKKVNMYGKREPYEGSFYCGLILYDEDNPNYREYIGVRLADPLIRDSLYRLSFMVSAGQKSRYLIDRLGICFEKDSIFGSDDSPLKQVPKILTPEMVPVGDTAGWSKLIFPYRALGGECFLTIGNFQTDENVKLLPLSARVPFRLVYMYLDGFELTPTFKNPMNRHIEDFTIKPKPVRLTTKNVTGEKLFVPNLITPNEDGYNDYFFIPGLPPYSGLIIFNNRRKVVYQTRHYRNDWSGKDLQEGKYSYELTLSDGNIILGSFELAKKKQKGE